MALYIARRKTIYFDSFGVEHLPKEVIEFLHGKNLTLNIFRIQDFNNMFAGRALFVHANLFSLTVFKRNHRKIKIKNYFCFLSSVRDKRN